MTGWKPIVPLKAGSELPVTICPPRQRLHISKTYGLYPDSYRPNPTAIRKLLMSRSLPFVVCIFLAVSVVGCQKAPPPEFKFDQVEWLKQEKLHLNGDAQFSAEYLTEIPAIMEASFGTPEHAWFPFEASADIDAGKRNIVSVSHLGMAAGPVSSEEKGLMLGLYRKHCAECHGVTGDGAGPTAALLNPYPRDFRLGKFKFKSTPQRRPPTDGDLRQVLEHGIPGTAMPSFKKLSDEEIDALVDYVKYLSIRGNFEKYLMLEVPALDDEPFLSADDQKKWFDPVSRETEVSLGADKKDDAPTIDYQERTEVAEQVVQKIRDVIGDQFWEFVVDRWAAGDANISEVPEVPVSLDPKNTQHQSLVDSGRELFLNKGGCVQCHGADGRGNGITDNSYDDWDNHWLKSPGVDPTDKKTYKDFKEAGALKPRVVKPRNLRLGVFRGGGEPETLYRRLANGIEGTPMPAATALSEDEIWALVAYVKSLSESEVETSDLSKDEETEP